MATDFLAYWKPGTVDAEMNAGGPVDHAGSAQFARVQPGDAVWVVTIRGGRLLLVTSIAVGHVTSRDGAAGLLGISAGNLWDAEHHIVAAEGTAREIAESDIQHLAPRLRFVSASGNDRLTIGEDGTVYAQQLQTMRVLSPASAKLLAEASQATILLLPGEVAQPGLFVEGATRQVFVNTYERSRRAVSQCKAVRGTMCVVCGFDFGAVYGPEFAGFIHVHHLRPLSEVGGEYVVDPAADLCPVCPNCHAVIHHGGQMRTVDEVRRLLEQQRHAEPFAADGRRDDDP